MSAQIIFFLALTLFLILLVRHFRVSTAGVGQFGQVIAGIGRSLGKFSASFGTKLVSRAKTVKSKIPLVSDTSGEPALNDQSHAFWRDEAAGTKSEVAGFFDEGEEFFKKGDFAKAEEFFLKAATRNPSDARVYARLGYIYLQQKDFNDAIESLKVAVKCDKYNPSRHYNLALAYLGNNDRQKAIAAAREAITLDPVTKKYRTLLEQLLNRK